MTTSTRIGSGDAVLYYWKLTDKAIAVQLPLFLWVVLGSADIEKLRKTPSGVYSSQAVSACSLLLTNAWYRSSADLQGVAACLVDPIWP